jgi:hypothetical protein
MSSPTLRATSPANITTVLVENNVNGEFVRTTPDAQLLQWLLLAQLVAISFITVRAT